LTNLNQEKQHKNAKLVENVIVANSSKPVNKNNNNRQQGDKSLQSQENQ
jgi:hypothetical protein